MAKVYIKVGTESNIVAVDSEYFITDFSNWILIDEGNGDKYSHAQGNYFNKPIVTDKGIYRYRLVDDVVVEKTEEEILTEQSAQQVIAKPSIEDQLAIVQSAILALMDIEVT
jgi:hypothetical protein